MDQNWSISNVKSMRTGLDQEKEATMHFLRAMILILIYLREIGNNSRRNSNKVKNLCQSVLNLQFYGDIPFIFFKSRDKICRKEGMQSSGKAVKMAHSS